MGDTRTRVEAFSVTLAFSQETNYAAYAFHRLV